LINTKEFKDSLEKAGSVASLIGIGLVIYEQVKDSFKTKEEIAFDWFYS
jgi:hypothetical protein